MRGHFTAQRVISSDAPGFAITFNIQNHLIPRAAGVCVKVHREILSKLVCAKQSCTYHTQIEGVSTTRSHPNQSEIKLARILVSITHSSAQCGIPRVPSSRAENCEGKWLAVHILANFYPKTY